MVCILNDILFLQGRCVDGVWLNLRRSGSNSAEAARGAGHAHAHRTDEGHQRGRQGKQFHPPCVTAIVVEPLQS